MSEPTARVGDWLPAGVRGSPPRPAQGQSQEPRVGVVGEMMWGRETYYSSYDIVIFKTYFPGLNQSLRLAFPVPNEALFFIPVKT